MTRDDVAGDRRRSHIARGDTWLVGRALSGRSRRRRPSLPRQRRPRLPRPCAAMPIFGGAPAQDYSIHHFLAKLFVWTDSSSPQPRHPPACIPGRLRSSIEAFREAAENCCVPIAWQHHITTLGERELTALVHQLGIRLPAGNMSGLSPAEVRAFAVLGSRTPPRYTAADSWRAVAEDSLERWWKSAHGEGAPHDQRFVLAREHTLRGIPRVKRGSDAGEFLWAPVSSAHIPLEKRGVSPVWLRALFAWMHELCLFKLPTRVFVECFVALVTAEQPCALYDLVPEAFRCAPQTFACHAWDDELYAMLAASHDACWISFVAVDLPKQRGDGGDGGGGEMRDDAEARVRQLATSIPACIAACTSGLLVCLPGRGDEPAAALRPLRRAWCLFEMCSAVAADDTIMSDERPPTMDPYGRTVSFGDGRVRFAFGGLDDDVERHRTIAEAIDRLSCRASAASHVDEEMAIKGVLVEHGHAVERAAEDEEEEGSLTRTEARLRELVRRAFWVLYSRPQHAYVRALYQPRAVQ